uniref:Uncharacterized protein n=1 Tax=Opuntia streptacantha TaxID=393608 RepID=A0A7C8ZXH8_OPUST
MGFCYDKTNNGPNVIHKGNFRGEKCHSSVCYPLLVVLMRSSIFTGLVLLLLFDSSTIISSILRIDPLLILIPHCTLSVTQLFLCFYHNLLYSLLEHTSNLSLIFNSSAAEPCPFCSSAKFFRLFCFLLFQYFPFPLQLPV